MTERIRVWCVRSAAVGLRLSYAGWGDALLGPPPDAACLRFN